MQEKEVSICSQNKEIERSCSNDSGSQDNEHVNEKLRVIDHL